MRLRKETIQQDLEGERLLILALEEDEAFRGLVRANKSAALVLDCLREETDEEAILARLRAAFHGDEADMRADIRMILDRLREIGALE